jgi:hypothetical protein
MTTDTDIVNRALQQCGARSTIANLQEKSEEARNARMIYTSTRQQMLRAAHWNFARKTAYLSVLKSAPGTPENPSEGTTIWVPATQPAPPWMYEYAYPSDCLDVRFITPQIATSGGALANVGVPAAYYEQPYIQPQAQRFLAAMDTIEGQQVKVVLCNQQQAVGVYTCDIENPQIWDSLFSEAMVQALCVQLVIPLSGDKSLKGQASQAAMQAINTARVRDGNEGLTINDHVPDWIRVRGYSGDWSTGTYVGAYTTPSFLLI